VAKPLNNGGAAADFERALANDEFELHYQPIAGIASGRIETLEALVRWRHPSDGLLMPGHFLPTLERSTTIWRFTLHVLEKAAAHLRDWIAAGHACQVAVNVSAHLVTLRLAHELAQLLGELGVPPRMVALEVTESAVMQDPVAATRALEQLAMLGIGTIAIDDFGTGYSNLGRLRDLPIDALKVDRSFVAELDRGVDPAFVSSVIDLAHHLGLTVTAEGIEDEETWRCLARLGCDNGQGYWLSRPLPAGDVEGWLAQHDIARLAQLGVVGERRHGAGRRALDRIADAFDRAAQPMLLSDPSHCWAAVNAAARSLLQVEADALVERHVDDTVRRVDGLELTSLFGAMPERLGLAGLCEVVVGDGTKRRVRYELGRSMIPDHHFWVLTPL
jgi:EAL domain-containing protein (putative c-di-GMP-specific phosphodiesterase class I)